MKLLKEVITSFIIIANPKQKKKAVWGLFFHAIQSIADVFGLAAIVPVLMLAIDGDFLEKSSKLRAIYKLFSFSSESQFLLTLILLVFVFFVAKSIFAIWLQNFTKKNAASIVERATNIKYSQFILNEYSEIVKKGSPDFINLVMNVPYHYVTGMLLPFMNLFSEVLIVLLFSVFIFYNPFVFLIVIVVLGPSIFLINRSVKSRVINLGKVSGDLREEVLEELNIGIDGITEIKLNKVSSFFINRFVKKQYAYARNEMKALTMQTIPSRMLEILALVGVIILVIYGYYFSNNASEIRVLGALFVISIFRLIPAINRILVSLMHIKIYNYTSVELLKSVKNYSKSKKKIQFNKNVVLKNISFTHEDGSEPLLSNINLNINRGDIIGITGLSGSGKSTLVKIFLQLLKQSSGSIYSDSVLIDKSNELSWQQLIGYVGQQPYILKGSIRENVALADEKADDLEIIKSLKMAGLEDFTSITMLDYQVGEKGIKLSEGQKQRLALARVIFKGQRIIVLDETTSALDELTEEKVMNTLTNLSKNSYTLLIIAHRKTVLKQCSKVYELKDKKLSFQNINEKQN
jgi:ABC-type multidrug transport system fused ATPase/permease subunit